MAAKPETAPPCAMVIFGGSGDLAKRLLMPALVNLVDAGRLASGFTVIGMGRSELDDESYRDDLTESLRDLSAVDPESEAWQSLRERIHYMAGDLTEGETFERIGGRLDDLREETAGNAIFYLATPPSMFGPIVEKLGAAGLTHEQGGCWRRVIIEKPFGTDLQSAKELNETVLGVLEENQVFRIDHFLGKETVQNIMMLRFSNGIFEPLWNRGHIDHVQISVAETIGVEGRGSFYEKTGALRDMVPNHLFQLLSLTAMEAPASFGADAIRSEKVKAVSAVRSYDCATCLDNVVRGQYQAGRIDGEAVPGYRDEPEVDARSTTETYVAMKLLIDNWRWAGVPFYLRTGKRMAAKSSQIAIQFKQAPLALFRDMPEDDGLVRNFLVLQLAPDEGISLQFGAKVPGQGMRVAEVSMDFCYKDHFELPPNTGYETLIYDCMMGDPTLFQRADFIEAGWRVLQPMLDAWEESSGDGLALYEPGSGGPRESDALLARDGRHWHALP